MRAFYNSFFFIVAIICFARCANVVPPTGGAKDVTPPKLLSVNPVDSQLNTKVTRIDLRFNEFITLDNPSKEITFSPLLPVPFFVINNGKTVTLKVPDTALMENTTYRISFGNAIKDLHEGNPFTGFEYLFSTTDYFDSLRLSGIVYDAATGLPDSSANVVLYAADENDTAIVRKKPMYITKIGAGGIFNFTGLPSRPFRIYALKDGNDNFIFDGGKESVAFIDSIVHPVDSIGSLIELNLFVEKLVDTVASDTVAKAGLGGKRTKPTTTQPDKIPFAYTVDVDTADVEKRTFDINKNVMLRFSKPVDTFNAERVFLSYDSTGIDVSADFTLSRDTGTKLLQVTSVWKEDAVYTLRLLKGFATDTSGAEAMPSRYTFHTKSIDDYAKLAIHLPTKYTGETYLLMVMTGSDTVYNEPVIDSMVRLTRLVPGSYRMQIVVDSNLNGKWDTGDLLAKIQPELVIPYSLEIQLKAGWDNLIDFEKEEGRRHNEPKKPLGKRGREPKK